MQGVREAAQSDAPNAPTPQLENSLEILMVAPQPFFRPRGTPFSVLHRIRALCEAGHKVDLLTYPFGDDVEIPGLTIHRAARPIGVSDVRIGPSAAKIFLDLKLLKLTKKMLRSKKYDVLHTHEEAAFWGVKLARKYKLPHIYDMHSSLPQQLSNFKKFNLGPFVSIFESLEKKVLTTCDGVITICPDLQNRVDEEKLQVPQSMIQNFADDTRVFPPTQRDVRGEFGLKGKTIILYAGTFEAYQGIDLLLEAYARIRNDFPDSHLLMVGGRPQQVAEYKAQAEQLELLGQTTFVGQVQPNDIPPFVNECDILVSPRSRGTNTPLKIYSYMRSGKPLVATDLETHRQVLDDEVSLLVPATPEGFAEGLRQMLESPELRQKVVAAALAYATEHFTDAVYIDRVNDFYAQVMRKKGG